MVQCVCVCVCGGTCVWEAAPSHTRHTETHPTHTRPRTGKDTTSEVSCSDRAPELLGTGVFQSKLQAPPVLCTLVELELGAEMLVGCANKSTHVCEEVLGNFWCIMNACAHEGHTHAQRWRFALMCRVQGPCHPKQPFMTFRTTGSTFARFSRLCNGRSAHALGLLRASTRHLFSRTRCIQALRCSLVDQQRPDVTGGSNRERAWSTLAVLWTRAMTTVTILNLVKTLQVRDRNRVDVRSQQYKAHTWS